MSDIQTTCPQCQAILEVPADAVGKQAQCPACQHVFTVPAPTPPTDTPPETSPSAETPPPIPPSAAGPPAWGPPVSPPPAGPAGNGATERSAAANPYAPVQRVEPGDPARVLPPVQIGTPEPADYINATWSLFRSAWRPLVAAGTLAFVINSGSSLLGTVLTIAAQESGNPVFGILNGVMRLILGLASLYVTLGLMRMSTDLARGQAIRFSHVFQVTGGMYGRSLLGYILLVLPMALVVLPLLLVGVASRFDPGAMVLAGVVCFLPLLLVTFLLFFYLWAFMYFLVDRETGLRAAYRMAYQVCSVNKLNTLILLLLSMALSSAGVCACFVGQVASVPGTILLVAVAYLQMTGQPIVLPPVPQPGVSQPGVAPPEVTP